MPGETREKSFDCVKWARERRSRMYEETKDMSPAERRRRSESRRPTDPLLAGMYDHARPPSAHQRTAPWVIRKR